MCIYMYVVTCKRKSLYTHMTMYTNDMSSARDEERFEKLLAHVGKGMPDEASATEISRGRSPASPGGSAAGSGAGSTDGAAPVLLVVDRSDPRSRPTARGWAGSASV